MPHRYILKFGQDGAQDDNLLVLLGQCRLHPLHVSLVEEAR